MRPPAAPPLKPPVPPPLIPLAVPRFAGPQNPQVYLIGPPKTFIWPVTEQVSLNGTVTSGASLAFNTVARVI